MNFKMTLPPYQAFGLDDLCPSSGSGRVETVYLITANTIGQGSSHG